MHPWYFALTVLPLVAVAHAVHSSQQRMLLVPDIPPLRTLRLATLKDIPRIGLVAAASFYHSPYFHYQRPDHQKFPFDTVASYRAQFTEAIIGNDSVVIIAEDTPEDDEIDHVYDELKEVYLSRNHATSLSSSKIVIGVCSLNLQANSARSGQFVPESSGASPPHPDPENLERDQSDLAKKLLNKTLTIPERKLSHGRMVLDMVAVHPRYWNRGHGTTLVKWVNDLADIDQEGIAVAAAKMGVGLFQHVGYRLKEVVEIKGYDRHPESIFSWLGYREPASVVSWPWRTLL